MSAIEQEIFEIVKRLDDAKKQRLLDIARELETPESRSYTLEELLEMPPEERNRAVIQSLRNAQHKEVELFEAYSDKDFDDD